MHRKQKKKKSHLTIRKRLVISNILMITIPIVICVVLGLSGLKLIWSVVVHDGSIGFEDSEEFSEYAGAVSEIVEEILEEEDFSQKAMQELSEALEGSRVNLRIYEEDDLIYEMGNEPPELPEHMYEAVQVLDGECTIVQDEYCLYSHWIRNEGQLYQIYFTAEVYAPSYETLYICLALLILFLIAAVLVSVWMTNRFLTRFVFRKIEDPLELLEYGVAQIRDGNLEYRIPYEEHTEFLPVCQAFNEMAVRLKQSVEQTLQNERSRKELFAGISHDIRSPLTSIQAYVEGLLDGVANTPERQQKYLLTIKQKSESISNMVSQIFMFSKMELDDFPVNLAPMDIREALEEILQPLAEEYRQKGLQIQLHAEHAALQLDSVLLSRICTNILSNSLKYAGKPEIQVEITSQMTEGQYVLRFADNGVGVAEETLGKLFDVFYRSDPSRNCPEKGSGLGLAIVANAVKRMHGTVRAKNREGGGLEILISLPREENHGTDSDCGR